MVPSSSHIETLAVHAGMAGVSESGSHVPVIDLSTTNPLPGVEVGGNSYENLATGGEIAPGQSAVLYSPDPVRGDLVLGQAAVARP